MTGLIRLNPNPAITEFETIPINKAHDSGVKEFVEQYVKLFRSIIVDHIEKYVSGDNSDAELYEVYIGAMYGTIIEAPMNLEVIDYIKSINPNFIKLDPSNKTYYNTIKQYIIDLNTENDKEEIKKIYFLEMKNDGYGDDLIIQKFKDITKINVVIFDDRGGEEGSNSKITIMGNFCYNGIWLRYNGSDHYNIIFPTNITNRVYRNIPELKKHHFPVARKNIQELTYHDYEEIIAKTTIKEVTETQAIPGSAPAKVKPAPAPAKVKPAPAPAKVKPEPAPAKVKPAEAKVKPAPAKVKPANPAHAQGEEATLRRAGASRVSSGQAPTQVEGQSEGQSEGQIQGQSEKVERQSEEQKEETIQAPTEENQIFRPDESNSGNMFVIPLMGVVLALAITFLVKK